MQKRLDIKSLCEDFHTMKLSTYLDSLPKVFQLLIWVFIMFILLARYRTGTAYLLLVSYCFLCLNIRLFSLAHIIRLLILLKIYHNVGAFWCLGHFVAESLCICDILWWDFFGGLGHFVAGKFRLGSFCLGTFCLGTFCRYTVPYIRQQMHYIVAGHAHAGGRCNEAIVTLYTLTYSSMYGTYNV